MVYGRHDGPVCCELVYFITHHLNLNHPGQHFSSLQQSQIRIFMQNGAPPHLGIKDSSFTEIGSLHVYTGNVSINPSETGKWTPYWPG
jgi:hypothetical protein